MRAHEFLSERAAAEYEVPDWLAMATKHIYDMIDSGKIPNNPESIKAASEQFAMDNKSNVEGLDGNIIADEIETQLAHRKITKKAHLSGDYGE